MRGVLEWREKGLRMEGRKGGGGRGGEGGDGGRGEESEGMVMTQEEMH